MNNKHTKDRKVYFLILIHVSPQSGEKMKMNAAASYSIYSFFFFG